MRHVLDGQTSILEPLLPGIRRHADALDQSGDWPANDLQDLARAGILGLAIPTEFGGAEASSLTQHLVYEAIARASLGVALILSQRDAAIGLIEASTSNLRRALLLELAAGAFSTVGIAQLTTSRQGGTPALRAEQDSDGYRVNGVIPWCTGAAKAMFIVAGATNEGSRQILFSLPADAAGLTIDPPMPLVALRSAWTTSLHCDGVLVPDSAILQGPADKVLARNNHLPLGQAFLAIGLCRGALDLIQEHQSAAARTAAARFESHLHELRGRIMDLSQPGREADATAAAPEIRSECNDLALRITHASVALYKGTALLAGHPAQRLAREAMFLLVWSCPNPVIDCTIDLLSLPP
jgi:alkylation response protein AidB-like acyl-CoA dehydrogenase